MPIGLELQGSWTMLPANSRRYLEVAHGKGQGVLLSVTQDSTPLLLLMDREKLWLQVLSSWIPYLGAHLPSPL